MPATNAAIASARLAAEAYADSVLARRRAYETLPAGDPGLTAVAAAFWRAFSRFLASLEALRSQGGEAEALALLLDVQDRTRAARTPVEVTISEEG